MLFVCCCGQQSESGSVIRLISNHRGFLGCDCSLPTGSGQIKTGPNTFPSLYLAKRTITVLHPFQIYPETIIEGTTTVPKWQGIPFNTVGRNDPITPGHIAAIGLIGRIDVTCSPGGREEKHYRLSAPQEHVRTITVSFEQAWSAGACIDEMRAACIGIPSAAFPTADDAKADFGMNADGTAVPNNFAIASQTFRGALTHYHGFSNQIEGSGAGIGFGQATVILQRRLHRQPAPWCLYETAYNVSPFARMSPFGPVVCTPDNASAPMIIEPVGSAVFTPAAHSQGYVRRVSLRGQALSDFEPPTFVPPCCT